MSSIVKQHIFVVDDEQGICDSICETLERCNAKVTCFTSAAECLKQLMSQECDLLITDLRMPEMDGIELVTNVKQLKPWLPILIVTGYGDIPTSVRAIKAGAVDFIEKPLQMESFIYTVEAILQEKRNDNCMCRSLTRRELTVLQLVLDGKSSREISDLTNRSVRTIEAHRSHIMHKLGVDNLVSLVKRVAEMGLVDQSVRKGPGQTA